MPKVQEGLQYAKKYSEEELQSALKAIEEGMPLREAAKKFNIPRATLQFRKGEKFVETGFSPNPVSTKEVEALLEKWIIEFGKKGFHGEKKTYNSSSKSCTKDGRTGYISKVKFSGEGSQKVVQSYLQAKGYDSILTDPRRIINGDETCLNHCPKNTRVLAPRGMTTPPMIIFPGKRQKDQIYKSLPPEWGIGMSD
ncbi:hypothetical protein JTB14_010712 [Gonioctena quinquepunctata]|nr:hypothetical protein JTB14_010712 [Gonioctena quinquepunctata]